MMLLIVLLIVNGCGVGMIVGTFFFRKKRGKTEALPAFVMQFGVLLVTSTTYLAIFLNLPRNIAEVLKPFGLICLFVGSSIAAVGLCFREIEPLGEYVDYRIFFAIAIAIGVPGLFLL